MIAGATSLIEKGSLRGDTGEGSVVSLEKQLKCSEGVEDETLDPV